MRRCPCVLTRTRSPFVPEERRLCRPAEGVINHRTWSAICLPLLLRAHAHVRAHARCLHVEAGTDINHRLGGAPGSSLQPADRKPDKRARTRMDRVLDRALRKTKQKKGSAVCIRPCVRGDYFQSRSAGLWPARHKRRLRRCSFWILRLENVPVQRWSTLKH